jgi:hypothetical protein
MPRSEPMGSDNIAPWGSPTRMRVLAVVTVVGGLLLAVVGLDLIAQHHNGGWAIFAFGGGALLLMGIGDHGPHGETSGQGLTISMTHVIVGAGTHAARTRWPEASPIPRKWRQTSPGLSTCRTRDSAGALPCPQCGH